MIPANREEKKILNSVLFLLIALSSATLTLQAQTFMVLHTFHGYDGVSPRAPLYRDSGGNLYGTTWTAGTQGAGTVFKIDANNNFSVLYNFVGGDDGGNSPSGLVMDAAGNLYGSTLMGTYGAGNVFKIDTHKHFSVLYSFMGGDDGYAPLGSLVLDPAGNLYGAAASETNYTGIATLFKLDADNNFSVLYTFTGGNDGRNPYAGLIRDPAGNLYGTTAVGGALGYGTVFKLDTSNHLTVLHTFSGGPDGGTPWAALFMDAAGNLYGTAAEGGIPSESGGNGVVFKIDTSNNFSVLYAFTGGDDGGSPNSVVVDTAGNIYGTTSWLGRYYAGTVFKIDTRNNFSLLYTFTNGDDGGYPEAGLILDDTGNAYGTTAWGAGPENGVAFKIALPGAFTSPAKNTTLPPHIATFTWSANPGTASYQMWLGTTPRGFDLGYAGTSALKATFANLPVSGPPVYATLWGYSPGSGWLLLDAAQYTGGTYGQITSPAKGSTLSGIANFTWSPESGSPSYQLWLGSSPVSFDYGYAGTSDTQAYFNNLPTDGRTLYATLWGYAAGNWLVQDTATYTAGPAGGSQILSPPKGSVLTGTTVSFAWSPLAGAASYQLWVGSTPGAYDLGIGGTANTYVTLAGLPTDGRTVYVTLWALANGSWSVQDTATYTASH